MKPKLDFFVLQLSGVDGNFDLIPSEKEGFLFSLSTHTLELAKGLKQMIENSELLLKTGQEFQKRIASHFTADRWVKDLLGIYQIG